MLIPFVLTMGTLILGIGFGAGHFFSLRVSSFWVLPLFSVFAWIAANFFSAFLLKKINSRQRQRSINLGFLVASFAIPFVFYTLFGDQNLLFKNLSNHTNTWIFAIGCGLSLLALAVIVDISMGKIFFADEEVKKVVHLNVKIDPKNFKNLWVGEKISNEKGLEYYLSFFLEVMGLFWVAVQFMVSYEENAHEISRLSLSTYTPYWYTLPAIIFSVYLRRRYWHEKSCRWGYVTFCGISGLTAALLFTIQLKVISETEYAKQIERILPVGRTRKSHAEKVCHDFQKVGIGEDDEIQKVDAVEDHLIIWTESDTYNCDLHQCQKTLSAIPSPFANVDSFEFQIVGSSLVAVQRDKASLRIDKLALMTPSGQPRWITKMVGKDVNELLYVNERVVFGKTLLFYREVEAPRPGHRFQEINGTKFYQFSPPVFGLASAETEFNYLPNQDPKNNITDDALVIYDEHQVSVLHFKNNQGYSAQVFNNFDGSIQSSFEATNIPNAATFYSSTGSHLFFAKDTNNLVVIDSTSVKTGQFEQFESQRNIASNNNAPLSMLPNYDHNWWISAESGLWLYPKSRDKESLFIVSEEEFIPPPLLHESGHFSYVVYVNQTEENMLRHNNFSICSFRNN